VEPLKAAKRAFELMDSHDGEEIGMNIIACKPGDEIKLDPTHVVRAFATDHRVPSLGFLVVRTHKSGLAAEYKDCSRDELLALKVCWISA
jgi:hypothetical protein